MSYDNHAIFEAPEGSAAYKACDQFLAEHHAAFTANRQFAINLGAIEALIGSQLVAFRFPADKVPAEFRLSRKHYIDGERAYEISSTSKRGKELKQEIATLPEVPGSLHFDSLLGCRSLMCRNLRILHCGFETVAGKRIVFVPMETGDKPYITPEGCTRLKLSEFYALKESEPKETEAAS